MDGRGDDAARLAAAIAEAERKERERLAEALHDDALQRLLVARQDLNEAPADPEVVRSVAAQLEELTASLRALTKAMHEETLAAMPLAAALERLAEDAARRGRLAVTTEVDPVATGDHDPFVLGIVRELLSNVVKHARARTATVSVGVEDGEVTIRVHDDGRGMDAGAMEAAARAGHLGHARLQRRLSAIGGRLDVDSAPERGCRITCRLPLDQLAEQRALEEELRRERRWSAALVAAMQDGFLVLRDGEVVQVNDRLCAMTGHRRDALLGPPAERQPLWSDDGLDLLLGRPRSSGGFERQVEVERADGSRFPAIVSGRLMLEDGGGDAGVLVTVKDITALQQAAERASIEHELGAVVATTNRLRGLLDAARAVDGDRGVQALLGEICRTVHWDLGWAVVLHLHRPAWDDFVVATSAGLPPDAWAALEGSRSDWEQWLPLLDERHERRGAYLVLSEQADPAAPQRPAAAPVQPWGAGDLLLIPVRHTQGHFLGILSLDAPDGGMRPTDAEIDVLVAVAAHAALALQHAQRAVEAGRHAAALEQLLDVSSRIAATREIGPMLDVVAAAISAALGFERVVVETVGPDGRLLPRASTAAAAGRVPLDPVAPSSIEGLLHDGFVEAGCSLLTHDEAIARMPAARRDLIGSTRNGAGWRAWDDHVLLVGLRGGEGELVGVIWVDDPEDRLLPAAPMLQALAAFANQATAAMIAAERSDRLASSADVDELTALGNRRAFGRELARELARVRRTGSSGVLLLAVVEGLDVPVPAGRPLATRVGEAFTSELRAHDRAFRLDGDLFALLLVGGPDGVEADVVRRRLCLRLRAMGPGLDVRFGAARLEAERDSADAVVRRAGSALLAGSRAATG